MLIWETELHLSRQVCRSVDLCNVQGMPPPLLPPPPQKKKNGYLQMKKIILSTSWYLYTSFSDMFNVSTTS